MCDVYVCTVLMLEYVYIDLSVYQVNLFHFMYEYTYYEYSTLFFTQIFSYVRTI